MIYERRFGKRSMFEIDVPLVTTNSLLTRTTGPGDVAVGVKHALHTTTTRIVAAGLEVVLPTGDRFKDHGSGAAFVEPFISAGALVRNWFLQAELRTEASTNTVRARPHIVYNGYVGRDLSRAPNTWTIGAELNGKDAEVALTPQLRKGLTATGALAASAGMMLPLNRREEQGLRWVGYLLWEYLEPWRARR